MTGVMLIIKPFQRWDLPLTPDFTSRLPLGKRQTRLSPEIQKSISHGSNQYVFCTCPYLIGQKQRWVKQDKHSGLLHTQE